MRKLYKNTINHWLPPFMAGLIAHIRRGPIKENHSLKEVALPRMNGQIEKVLSITDILQQMSDRQSLITEDLRKRKIGANLLHTIQNELVKEWKTRSFSPGSQSPEEDIINITIDTTRQSGLLNHTFDDKDLQFMLKIGWKLAQYKVGISQQLEADAQYVAIKAELVKQLASISNEKVNNVTTAYLSFSFALNSGYLFSNYLLANPKMKKPTRHNLSPLRIKDTRDRGLKALLSYSQEVVEDIVKSSPRSGPVDANT